MLLNRICRAAYLYVPYNGDFVEADAGQEFQYRFCALNENRSWVEGAPEHPRCNPRRAYVAGISTLTGDLIAYLIDIERRKPEEGSPWLWILHAIDISPLNDQNINVALQALAANEGRFSSLDDCGVMVRRIHDNPPVSFPDEESKNDWHVRNVMRALSAIRYRRLSMLKRDSSPSSENAGGQENE